MTHADSWGDLDEHIGASAVILVIRHCLHARTPFLNCLAVWRHYVRTCQLNSRLQAFERFGAMEPGPMVVMERNHDSDHDEHSHGRHSGALWDQGKAQTNHRARSMGFAFITFLE